jgi:hypothetical protein
MSHVTLALIPASHGDFDQTVQEKRAAPSRGPMIFHSISESARNFFWIAIVVKVRAFRGYQ